MSEQDSDAGHVLAPRLIAECRTASALCSILSECHVDGILWGDWQILYLLGDEWVDDHGVRQTPTRFVPFPPPVKIPAPHLTLDELNAEIAALYSDAKANSAA